MTFNFSIKDSIFPQCFEGEIKARSKNEAKEKIKDIYAQELDTEKQELEIISLYQKV